MNPRTEGLYKWVCYPCFKKIAEKNNKNLKRYTSNTFGLANGLAQAFLSFPDLSCLVVLYKHLNRQKILVPKVFFNLMENSAVRTLRHRSLRNVPINKFNCVHGHPKAQTLKAVVHSQSFEFFELNSDTHREKVFWAKKIYGNQEGASWRKCNGPLLLDTKLCISQCNQLFFKLSAMHLVNSCQLCHNIQQESVSWV